MRSLLLRLFVLSLSFAAHGGPNLEQTASRQALVGNRIVSAPPQRASNQLAPQPPFGPQTGAQSEDDNLFAAATDHPSPTAAPDELIVRFRSNVGSTRQRALLVDTGGAIRFFGSRAWERRLQTQAISEHSS